MERRSWLRAETKIPTSRANTAREMGHPFSQTVSAANVNSSRNCHSRRIRDILPVPVTSHLMANLFELPRYIAVEGPLRVGKSTLARILGERLNAQRVMEPEGNPFLGEFYEGERGAAFQTQFTFLIRRFEQLQALDLGARSQRTVVADFIFEKDKLFAYLNLTDQELDTYNRYYNYFRDQLPTPDLVIYLQATPEVLKKRLKKKNAPGEKAVSDEYLQEVIKAYEHFFFHYTSSDLLIVNTSEIDFVDRNEDLQELLRKVTEPIKGTQYFLPLGGQEAAGA